MTLRTLVSGFALALVLAGPAVSGPVEDAEAAYAADQKGDYATAMKLYQSAALGGNAYAMYSIGLIYFDGKGVDRSYVQALKWYKQAADKAYPQAQHAYGAMHEQGQGVKRNIPEAVKYYTMAANQGYTLSQNALGVIYTTGADGVMPDTVQAYKWFSLAAKEDASAGSRAARLKGRLKPEQLAEVDKQLKDFKPKK
jgi:TPR repeat protein